MTAQQKYKWLMMVVFCFLSLSCSKEHKSLLQNGDIIFQTSKSSQSQAIQLATHSKYSHMGMIYINNEQYYVYEAAKTVKLTNLDEWIKRGVNKHFVVKRLKSTQKILSPADWQIIWRVGQKYAGKEYDLYFEWSDNKFYCSELVWKIYKEAMGIELGKLQTMRDFDLSQPLVEKQLKQRYGDNIPLHESVISPAQMFNSVALETVYIQ